MEDNPDCWRRGLYKPAGKDVMAIQKAFKEELFASQHEQREKHLMRKRLKVNSLEEMDVKLSADEEYQLIKNAIKMMRCGQKDEGLTILRVSLARNPLNAELFLRYEGLPLLQSCFLTSDSNLLHKAAWCAVNLTATTPSQQIGRVMCLSPLLVQFLLGSDTAMQELSAWAVGNLADVSQKCRQILLKQGVIPCLLGLISVFDQTASEAATKSALFALINLARDTSYECIRCMQQNSLYTHLQRLLKDVQSESELCLELGWLAACVYSRQETFVQHRDQYDIIFHLALVKLMYFSKIDNDERKEKLMYPYLILCGNVVALSPDMCLLASDLKIFLPCMSSCLSGQPYNVQLQTLWVLANFSAEVSCRVLLVCHSDLTRNLLSLCSSTDSCITDQVLYIFEAITRTSTVVNKVLVQQRIMDDLSKVLPQLLYSPVFLERALHIVEDLIPLCHPEQVQPHLKSALEIIISVAFSDNIVNKTKHILQCYLNG